MVPSLDGSKASLSRTEGVKVLRVIRAAVTRLSNWAGRASCSSSVGPAASCWWWCSCSFLLTIVVHICLTGYQSTTIRQLKFTTCSLLQTGQKETFLQWEVIETSTTTLCCQTTVHTEAPLQAQTRFPPPLCSLCCFTLEEAWGLANLNRSPMVQTAEERSVPNEAKYAQSSLKLWQCLSDQQSWSIWVLVRELCAVQFLCVQAEEKCSMVQQSVDCDGSVDASGLFRTSRTTFMNPQQYATIQPMLMCSNRFLNLPPERRQLPRDKDITIRLQMLSRDVSLSYGTRTIVAPSSSLGVHRHNETLRHVRRRWWSKLYSVSRNTFHKK